MGKAARGAARATLPPLSRLRVRVNRSLRDSIADRKRRSHPPPATKIVSRVARSRRLAPHLPTIARVWQTAHGLPSPGRGLNQSVFLLRIAVIWVGALARSRPIAPFYARMSLSPTGWRILVAPPRQRETVEAGASAGGFRSREPAMTSMPGAPVPNVADSHRSRLAGHRQAATLRASRALLGWRHAFRIKHCRFAGRGVPQPPDPRHSLNSIRISRPSGLARSRQFEAIQSHHFGPRVNEMMHEIILCVVGCIELGDCTQFRVGTED